jgi:RHS repeat-associated protein
VAGGNGGSGTVKAFVSIIVFDKNHKLLDFAWDGIDPAANQAGATPVVAHDYVMREYTAKEEGFVYLYVSNESPTLVDVYFDDVAMTYTPGNVVQYNEYYPFGLQTANSWTRENATGNNFLYNGGTELNTTTSVYDLHYRNYDPILGRMNQVDPLASKFGSVTPYNYAFNAPTNFNDPLGDQSWGDIFRVVADLWRQAGANGTANWRRPMDTGSGTAGSWANFGAMGDGGGRPGTLFGGGRSDFFAPGWKPGQGSLSARAFARQDAAIAQAQAARDTQFGFSLFPGATTSGNNTGYYNYMLAPAVESTLNGRVQDSHFATSTVDFGKEDYLKMYADAGMPLGYSSTNQTKPGLQYNQYLDTGLTATGFIAGAFESGSAIATAQNLRTISYSTAKSGLKLTKNLGTVGLVLSAGVAIHEFATDHDNTHTWVDLGVAGLGVAAVAVIGTVALPAVAIIGLGYTVWSAAGGSDG